MLFPYLYLILYAFQSFGMQGFIVNTLFCIFKPKIYLIPASYIHELDPVYHVHPPLPAKFF